MYNSVFCGKMGVLSELFSINYINIRMNMCVVQIPEVNLIVSKVCRF